MSTWFEKHKKRGLTKLASKGPTFNNCTFNGNVNINSEDETDNDKYSMFIHNNDRYGSDTHRVWIFKTATADGISLVLELRNERTGKLTYSEYWHYDKSEEKMADAVKEQLIKAGERIKDTVESQHTPIPVVMTLFRDAALTMDIAHKERSNVYNFNYYMLVGKEPDWRQSLYGGRYPDVKHPGRLGDEWKINDNSHEKNQAIESVGKNSRDKIVRTRYS